MVNVDNILYTQLVLTGVVILLSFINVVQLALEFVKADGQPIKKQKVLASGIRRFWISLITYVIITLVIAITNGVRLF
jgi:uncharacterized membrane protein